MQKHATGGIGGVVADVRIILKQALQVCATGFVAVHNHPSGSTTPSECDIKLTKTLKDSAAIMEIRMLDHVIISGTENSYYSFADEGMM